MKNATLRCQSKNGKKDKGGWSNMDETLRETLPCDKAPQSKKAQEDIQ